MFDNIGEKIKSLAVVTTWIGIISSIIGGLFMLINGSVGGIFVMIFGSLGAWIGSFVLYGFGQLITNTDIIAAASQGTQPSPSAQPIPAVPHTPVAPVMPTDPWVCAQCGFTNHPRVGTCQSCGVTKKWSDAQQPLDRT